MLKADKNTVSLPETQCSEKVKEYAMFRRLHNVLNLVQIHESFEC
jgi:hypothetical protein